MVEVDYVEPGITLHHSDVVDTAELYQIMKHWLEKRNYLFYEKEYHDTLKKEDRSLLIKWRADKKIDDYTKFVIEIKITGSDLSTVKLKNKKAMKGNITLAFESYLETDYENRFESSTILKIFRGLYDKLILTSKTQRYEKELKDETYAFRQDIKTYLGMEKTV